jgi:hypothetical protein
MAYSCATALGREVEHRANTLSDRDADLDETRYADSHFLRMDSGGPRDGTR